MYNEYNIQSATCPTHYIHYTGREQKFIKEEIAETRFSLNAKLPLMFFMHTS